MLAERLAQAYQLTAELTAQVQRLQVRVEELERQAGKDSGNSSRPPSSDSPYKKKPRDRSLRERGKRRPCKQPGQPGTTLRLTDDPDEQIGYSPACCRDCGTGLAGEPVLGQRRYQVTEIAPAPPPKVTEYLAQSKQCPCCGTVSEPVLPAHVRARASYGPEVHAQAANLVSGHYLPVARAVRLLAALAGITVSAGWMAAVRGKAAALITASGFPDTVRGLLRSAPALHADETPARAAGGLRYLHVACARYLTWMHTGDRSADTIDVGGVLRGYTGILVRDGLRRECQIFCARDFFLSGTGCLSGVFCSRYLVLCCPFYPVALLNRAFRAVPGLMLRVPVIRTFAVVLGACCLILPDRAAAVPFCYLT